MSARNIVIIGNYGVGNLGDDAILGGIVQDIKNFDPKIKVSVLHGGYKSSESIYKGLEKLAFMPLGIKGKQKAALTREKIKESDLVILGGGGLFVDSESFRAPLIWFRQAWAAYSLKTPYICYGQSIGPLKRTLNRSMTKWVFEHAQAIHVRDEDSAKYLKKLGIKKKIHVGTDAAFSYLIHEKTQKKEDLMLLSLRKWDKETEESWDMIVDAAREFAKKKSLKLGFISMHYGNKNEVEALKEYGDVYEPESAKEAYKLISSAKLLVSMRLHAGIFALAAKTSLLAISYSQKVESLFNSLKANRGFQMLKLNELSEKNILKSLSEIDSKSPSFDIESPIMKNQDFLSRVLSDL